MTFIEVLSLIVISNTVLSQALSLTFTKVLSLFNISSDINEIFLEVLSQALSMTFIEVLSL